MLLRIWNRMEPGWNERPTNGSSHLTQPKREGIVLGSPPVAGVWLRSGLFR